MDYLLLRFTDADIDQFEFCCINSSDTLTGDIWKAGDISAIQKLLGRSNVVLLIVLPQQLISHLSFEVPTKMTRQVISSIQYQIEDRLAIDVEDLHFVVADPDKNPVSVIVVNRAVMQACLDFLRTNGLKAESIIPEISLCPWFGNDEDVSVMQTQDGYIVRHHESLGFKASKQTLGVMLKNLIALREVQIVNYFGDDESIINEIELASDSVQVQPVLQFKRIVDQSFIDLQQGDFRVSSPVSSLVAAWRWVGVLIFILLLASGFNRAIALYDLETNLSEIKQAQWESIESSQPGLVAKNDNYKISLIKFMQENREVQTESGPLDLLFQFSRVYKNAKNIKVTRMNYQENRLQIDVEGKQLPDVESLQLKLAALGLNAELENLNIKPDRVTARVIVTGEQS